MGVQANHCTWDAADDNHSIFVQLQCTYTVFARGVDVFEVVKAFNHTEAAVQFLDDALRWSSM